VRDFGCTLDLESVNCILQHAVGIGDAFVLAQVLVETQPASGQAMVFAPMVRGVDPAREASVSVLPSSIVAGEFDLSRHGLVVGTVFAEKMNLHVGDRVAVYSPEDLKKMKENRGKEGEVVRPPSDYEIRGIFDAGYFEFNASIVVTGSDGTVSYGGARIDSVAPGLFTADASGNGVAAGVVRVLHADGTVTTTPTFTCSLDGDCIATPISLGTVGDEAVVELYGTGIRGRSSLENVTCTIGGIASQVLYAGPQGQYPGKDQVNVLLPLGLAGAGLVRLELSVDGHSANTVALTIR